MQIRIKGYTFQLSEPFQPGTVLTKPEAQALNQLRAENIQNSRRQLVVDATADLPEGAILPESVLAELQAKFTAYDLAYQFQEKNSPKYRIGDIEHEARVLAQDRIEADLRRMGREPDEISETEMETLVTEQAKHPTIIEMARDRVAAKRRAGSGTLEDL